MWLESYEWKKAPDGHVMIDLDGYERWAEGKRASAIARPQPEAGSTTNPKPKRRRPMQHPLPVF